MKYHQLKILIIVPYGNKQISIDDFEYTNWNEILKRKINMKFLKI